MAAAHGSGGIGGPIQSQPQGQRFGGSGIGQGFDTAFRELPSVGPVTEEESRSVGSTVAGIGSTDVPTGLNSGTGTSATGNGPVQSQSRAYNKSFGQKTKAYEVPPRTS